MTRYARRVTGLAPSGVRKWFEGAGPGSINLTLGQPDFDTPDHVKEAACRALAEGKTGYTPNVGIPELLDAIVEKSRRENGLEYAPDQVMVTAGASEALLLAMQVLVDEGDRVLHADPAFVSYAALASLAGGRPEGLPTGDGFRIEVEAAKERLDGAKVLVINSPSNPTGAVEPESSVRALVEYANDAGVTVISDEVYEHFVYDGVRAVSAGRFGDDVVTINATSKTYAMTGWRLGWFAGSAELVEQANKIHQYGQACASSIAQYAAAAALRGPQDCVGAMQEEYAARRELVCGGLEDLGIVFPRPEGAFYVFPPMDDDLVRRVIAAGVIVVPGASFGPAGTGHARIVYAASREALSAALERIAGVVRG
ncbi:MAG: aminotransferase class I/II-fold pyridoxal phosphate-dependent enzyme [Methanospirillum sp.]|nr:aminotransferase class I/II-fold pyridoxal phosphate-dependent enzyme [Methanospirillum sp.]